MTIRTEIQRIPNLISNPFSAERIKDKRITVTMCHHILIKPSTDQRQNFDGHQVATRLLTRSSFLSEETCLSTRGEDDNNCIEFVKYVPWVCHDLSSSVNCAEADYPDASLVDKITSPTKRKEMFWLSPPSSIACIIYITTNQIFHSNNGIQYLKRAC